MNAYAGTTTVKVHTVLTALADQKGALLALAERAAEYAAQEARLLEALEGNFAQPTPAAEDREAYYGAREELRQDLTVLRTLMKENEEQAAALLQG